MQEKREKIKQMKKTMKNPQIKNHKKNPKLWTLKVALRPSGVLLVLILEI